MENEDMEETEGEMDTETDIDNCRCRKKGECVQNFLAIFMKFKYITRKENEIECDLYVEYF